MERGLRAFFYDYRYYLFPDGMTPEELKAAGKVRVKHLREERCMAPDFIYESIVEETLKIEVPERVFEVEVNLYTGAEYDAILKKHVDRVCPGCERYEDDGTDNLDGHHEEMSLDGVCYLRNGEDEPWSFGYCTFVFWLRVADKLNELAACIDADDQEKLNSLINEELEHFYLPLKFYGTVRGGRYCLYLRGDWRNSPSAYATERYLAECGALATSPLVAAGWRVEYLLPEGVVKHKSAYDERCMGRVEMTEAGTTVYLYVPEGEDSTARANDVFECMAEDVGEYAALCAFAWVEPTASRVGMLPRKKFARQLKAAADAFLAAMDAEDEHALISPYATGYGYDGGADEKQLPYREKLAEGFTQAPDIALIDRDVLDGAKEELPWWLRVYAFGYLYFPTVHAGEDLVPVIAWYLGNLRDAPLYEQEENGMTAVNLGFGYGAERGFFLDMMVMDEKRFLRMLRMLAPMLQAYGAKAVIVNEHGAVAYECGYDFLPAGGLN